MFLKTLILAITISFIFSDNYKDAIYLKDGSIIYGEITEYKPNEYYYINSGGQILLLDFNDIDRIAMKVGNTEIESDFIESDTNNKTFTLSMGIFKSPSLFTFIKDFKINNHVSTFIYLSPKYFNLSDNSMKLRYGLGFSHQENFNQSGTVINITFGKYPDYNRSQSYFEFISDIFSLSGGYQIKTKNNAYWTFGFMILYKENKHKDWKDFIYTTTIEYQKAIIPTLSLDFRF